MGFAASSARLFMLTARKSDLEFQLQMINQSRMRLANIMDRLYMLNGNLDPDNPQVRAVEAQLAAIQQRDKILEIHARRIEMQHKAAETEMNAVEKVLNNNIQSSFKLMG